MLDYSAESTRTDAELAEVRYKSTKRGIEFAKNKCRTY
jgi:hypothetical protein